MFGDNLIHSKNVCINTPKGAIKEELNDTNHSKIFNKMCDILSEIIDKSGLSTNLTAFLNLIALENLADNTYTGLNVDFPLSDGKIFKIRKGMKCLKALRKILFSYGYEKEYMEFENRISLTLNTKKLEGELCISIHPLDYLTSATNDSKWESCLSWDKDLGYARGCVTMMNSPCIVVAYLKSKHNMRRGLTIWNNKKWRQFFYVGPEAIMPIKGYPYQSKDLTNICLNWLKELSPFDYDTYVENPEEAECNIRLDTYTMFNDLTNGPLCSYWINSEFNKKVEYILIEGDDQCLLCGNTYENVDFPNEGVKFCEECENLHYCCECDKIIDINTEPYYEYEGIYYCPECYEQTKICQCCGDEIDVISGYNVMVKDSDDMAFICNDCFNAHAFGNYVTQFMIAKEKIQF